MIITFDGTTPEIDPEAWVAPSADVIGDVRLGPQASVFYGAVLRGDADPITIGARSNLQDHVVAHTDAGSPVTIGEGVTVGHRAVLHGCTVEDGCLIGMSATLMNGSVIGAQSLVAAGSLVLEGTIVPPGSLVAGSPAKVRRALTDEEKAGLVRSSETYLRLSAVHADATGEV